ncbi:nickel pincer cofactor biosynthesis protein LarC [Pleurocapsa sp. CCALA 161]|uniref:nickel pincer cofactor biosynthesis protein LarC n=1 Tax=Pleurocapsa sp. CCALA 161 TaxID=2107688 RepID=UPI000D060861|nr:nickel pincer cofactor biosynthesis protein LarC [Pleurocapsa sp. CCALA 161]PSB12662.1 nickel pincer cofactor biosynthesis protein LarC [Pleurocapsa sp. CCALA 161]
MVKIGYWECPTGIAGDMCLGALVDCGLPWQYLLDSLKSLGIEAEYQLTTEVVTRNGQSATKVYVNLRQEHHHHDSEHHHPRHLPEIESLIQAASLPERVKRWSLRIFQQLAIAESAVHGIPPEQVHFHEVGATDAIIDIVGTCIGLDWLNLDRLYCSPLPTGGGTIKAAHGQLSVPVPAVVKLWETREVPIYSNGIQKELVTPTGAAIAVTLAQHFGEPPAMKLTKIGLGAGSKDLAIPNILRLWIGEAAENQPKVELQQETITVLETQIDDLSPQVVAYTLEQLLTAGALDVFTQSIGMKKSRSGILLTVICHPETAYVCKTIIFRETTTLGIRESTQQRSILNREIKPIQTKYGTVNIKVASWGFGENQQIINVQPEYEDCAALARQHNISWRAVSQQAIAVYQDNLNHLGENSVF